MGLTMKTTFIYLLDCSMISTQCTRSIFYLFPVTFDYFRVLGKSRFGVPWFHTWSWLLLMKLIYFVPSIFGHRGSILTVMTNLLLVRRSFKCQELKCIWLPWETQGNKVLMSRYHLDISIYFLLRYVNIKLRTVSCKHYGRTIKT